MRAANAQGFTLIELAIIVAVTAVVGAVGVSAYRTYGVRAQIAVSLGAAAPLQRAVESAFRRSGLAPADGAELGPAANIDAGDYVQSLDVSNGRVTINFGRLADETIAGRTLSITPFETADLRIVWFCGNKAPGPGLKPLGFAGGGPQTVQVPTTIEPRYLPPSCR